jgi:hypothetical protein
MAHIVKLKEGKMRIQKTSKCEFMAFQTYMLNCSLEKVAIEKEVEYTFLPCHYFDARKDELYLSVNSQIISFSLIFGEIRKNYSLESSNIAKHSSFFLGSRTPPFILDNTHSLYEVYLKAAEPEGENKSYKKKVAMREIVASFYDEEMRSVMLVNDSSVLIVRNDLNNNFNTVSSVHFEDIARIASCVFCSKTKYLTFMTSDQTIYQLKNFENKFSRGFRFAFERGVNEAVEKIIIQHDYCSRFEVLILLNNRNEVVIAERLNLANYVVIRLAECLPFKLQHLSFTRFSYHLLKEKTYQPSLLLYDDTGYLLDLNLQKIIASRFSSTKKEEIIIRTFLCESYEIKSESLSI